MTQPIELAFRQRVAAAFSEALGNRIYGVVSPPDAEKPVATYRRLTGGGPAPAAGGGKTANIGLTLRDEDYTSLKQLQRDIEEYLESLRGVWLADEDGVTCPIWVYQIKAETGQDAYQASTRDRVVSTVFNIHYTNSAQ